jgi:hypothetical protein
LESFVRAFLLTVDLVFLLPATWFLWCMLTGRRVVDVRPISRYRSDHQGGRRGPGAPPG